MKNDNNTSGGSGIGFIGLLTIVFITLKLLGVIKWSWLWVLSPLLICPLIILTIFLMMIFTSVILKNSRKKNK